MIRPWPEIREFYADFPAEILSSRMMLRLVEQILASRYATGIFGWTSHFDLKISQHVNVIHTDSYPYLHISVLHNGMLEFRYIDTPITELQWNRVVPEARAFAQLEHFFRQLHWFNDIPKTLRER
jgi:hypothetical protein